VLVIGSIEQDGILRLLEREPQESFANDGLRFCVTCWVIRDRFVDALDVSIQPLERIEEDE
jgi:hypothetical protein